MTARFAKAHMDVDKRSSQVSTGGARDALARRLLTAVSAAALAAGAPALVAPAHAQFPAECTPTNPTAGQTVTCTGNITDPISAEEGLSTGVADLTVNIGVNGGDAATVAVTTGDAVRISGNGTQTVNVSAGSSVSGTGGGSPAGVGAFSLNGGDVTINAQGQISGGFNGLEASTGGAGNIVVTATDVSAAANEGMSINLQDGATGNISITSTGLVTGGRGGVALTNNGSGVATVNVVDVTGSAAYGVSGINRAGVDGGGFSITATGLIQGEKQGVYVVDQASGDVTLDLARVSSNTNAGVAVTSTSTAAGQISVTASDTVQGETEGVRIVNSGTGGVTLTLADVTGTTQEGVFVSSADNSTSDILVTASGAVSGASHGVNVDNDSYGGVTVNVAGDVTGTANNAINVDNSYDGGVVSIIAGGAVIGGENGVFVENAASGSGNVGVNVASVTGNTAAGIRIANTDITFGGDTSVTASGLVTGQTRGVDIDNDGTGGVILDLASVIGNTDDGVHVDNSSISTGGISVTASGAITGEKRGVYINNDGTGGVTLDLASVTGNTEAGVRLESSTDSAGDISITTSGAVSGSIGIAASAVTDNLTIVAADVSGTSLTGINAALMSGGDANASITATGTVTGAMFGISVINLGAGDVSINAANVSGNANGITVSNTIGGGGGDISVVATGAVQASGASVSVTNAIGAVTLDLADVTSTAAAGVYARNVTASTSDISVMASGVVTGQTQGVDIRNFGAGDVTVSVADVTGNTQQGVRVRNSADSTGETMVTASGLVTGQTRGVDIDNDGTGGVTLNLASVTGITEEGVRVDTTSDSTGDVSVTASGAISGETNGVFISNQGAGGVTLDLASVTGVNDDAVTVINNANSTSGVSITASGALQGSEHGVWVNNLGAGGVTLDLAGVAATGSDSGVYISNQSASTGDVSVTASEDITAGTNGVEVIQAGTGAVTIDVAGVAASGGRGVFVNNTNTAGGDISVTASGAISADFSVAGLGPGVEIVNAGAGGVTLDLADVTARASEGVRVSNGANSTGEISVTASGAVSASSIGVNVLNQGTGGVTLDLASVISNVSSAAVFVDNEAASTGDVSVTASGGIIGRTRGVDIRNQGTGDVTLNLANVLGNTQEGVFVSSTDNSNNDISVTASGTVGGASHGVNVDNDSYGGVTVNVAGAVTGTANNGVNVDNDYYGGAVSITAGGAVTGGENGVFVENAAYGSGNVDVSVASVTGDAGVGIRVASTDSGFGGNTHITATGAVTGETQGVAVSTQGTGGITLNLASVTSNTDDGVYAGNQSNGAGDISITASGEISSARRGIEVRQRGTGGVTIDVASITTQTNEGIDVEVSNTNLGDVSISASGEINASNTGIEVDHDGRGALILNVASIAGNGGTGVEVDINNDAAGDALITASGDITGRNDGIEVDHDGTGGVTVNVADVTGVNVDGIFVDNEMGGGVTITAGVVSGGDAGLDVRNDDGAGDVSVDVASASGVSGHGLRVLNGSDSLGDILITASGEVSGGSNGLGVDNRSQGDAVITIGGAVTGTSEHGVYISNGEYNGDGGGAVSLTVGGVVTGGQNGVFIYNSSKDAGDVDISVAGAAGGSEAGIRVTNRNSEFAGDTSITASGAISGVRGLEMSQAGTGAVAIDIASVSATGGHGVLVDNTNTAGGDISVTASGSVFADASIGSGAGVEIRNQGTGAVTLDLAGVTAPLVQGVLVSNGANSMGDVSIAASGTVLGGFGGVHVTNEGAGGVALDVAAVSASFAEAIRVSSGANSMGDISITASGLVNGDNGGVHVTNEGAGGVTLDVAEVTASRATGILVTNDSSAAGDIVITASDAVTGGDRGVSVENDGTGAVTLAVNSVTGNDDAGILVSSSNAAAGDISITATGTVSGAADGVRALNLGGGDLAISVADVAGGTSGFVNGILASNSGANTGDLSITATGTVTGARDGVNATNSGPGGIVIDIVDVVGSEARGVYAFSSGVSTGDISITTRGSVTGAEEAVEIRNLGAGDVLFTALGDLSSASAGAVDIDNQGSGGVTVDIAGNVTKMTSAGVNVLNAGDGGVSISVGGNVSSAGNGIAADNAGNGDLVIAVGGDIDITTSAGVQATNRGDGDLSITTNGAVRNSGVGFGILATNEGAGDVMIVADGEVSGSFEGVLATNTGAGATMITVAGAVSTEADDLFGLRTETAAGASVTIDADGSVTGGAGAISFDGDGADVLTLNAGAAVNGLVRFNNGDDILRLAGGTFTEVQGGEGSNSVFLSGTSRTVDGLFSGEGASLSGFETLNIDGDGLILAGTFSGFDSATFLAGANTLTGTIEIDQVSIVPGATLITGGLTVAAASSTGGISPSSVSIALIDGDLTNSGVLNIAGSGTIGRLEITGDFTQEDGAALIMDVSDAATDVLSIGGDVVVAGDLVVEGSLAGTQVGDNTIRLIEGGGTLSGRLNVVADDGVLVERELVFDDAGGNVDLVVTLNDLSAVEGLNSNQSAVGDTILALIGDDDLDPGLADYITSILGLDTSEDVRTALAQLHPEALDFGLKSFTASQRLFTESMLTHAQSGGRPDAGMRAAMLQNGATFWTSVQGAGLGQDGQQNNAGFDGEIVAASVGLASLDTGRFSFGLAGGFSQFTGESDGSFGDNLEVQSFHIGASLGVDLDDAIADGWLIRADAVAAYAGGETELSMSLFNPEDGGRLNQRGEADITSFDVTGRLMLAGVHNEEWPVRPYTEFGVQVYRQDATRIGAAQPAGLQIDELNNTVGFAGVGVVYEQQWGDNLTAHGRVAGVRYFGDTQNTFNSRFAAAPNGPAFQTASQEVKTQVEIEAALSYQHKSGFTANMAAFGETNDLDVYGARFSLSKRF